MLDNLDRYIVDVSNKIVSKSINKITNEYKDVMENVIDNYYVITNTTPTNYSGSILNRSGLIKTGGLRNSITSVIHNDTKSEILGSDYGLMLSKYKNGKFNFIQKTIDIGKVKF